jgi:hypothetical protein
MAVETNDLRRQDIYTLFITTRIINFLKGLELSDSTDLQELLDRETGDLRTQIGFRLLRLLQETNRLNFWTNKGLLPNEKFQPEIFFRVLAEAGEIGCQNGQRIAVGEFPGSQAAQKDSEARRATNRRAKAYIGSTLERDGRAQRSL